MYASLCFFLFVFAVCCPFSVCDRSSLHLVQRLSHPFFRSIVGSNDRFLSQMTTPALRLYSDSSDSDSDDEYDANLAAPTVAPSSTAVLALPSASAAAAPQLASSQSAPSSQHEADGKHVTFADSNAPTEADLQAATAEFTAAYAQSSHLRSQSGSSADLHLAPFHGDRAAAVSTASAAARGGGGGGEEEEDDGDSHGYLTHTRPMSTKEQRKHRFEVASHKTEAIRCLSAQNAARAAQLLHPSHHKSMRDSKKIENGIGRPILPGEIFTYGNNTRWMVMDRVVETQYVDLTANASSPMPAWSDQRINPKHPRPRPDFLAVRLTEDNVPVDSRNDQGVGYCSFVVDQNRTTWYKVSSNGGKHIMKTWTRQIVPSPGAEPITDTSYIDLKQGAALLRYSKKFSVHRHNQPPQQHRLTSAIVPVDFYNSLMKQVKDRHSRGAALKREITLDNDEAELEIEEEEEDMHEDEEEEDREEEHGDDMTSRGMSAHASITRKISGSRVIISGRAEDDTDDMIPASAVYSSQPNTSAAAPSSSAAAASAAPFPLRTKPAIAIKRGGAKRKAGDSMGVHKDAIDFVRHRVIPSLADVAKKNKSDVSIEFAKWKLEIEQLSAQGTLHSMVSNKFSTMHNRWSKSAKKYVPTDKVLVQRDEIADVGLRLYLAVTDAGRDLLQSTYEDLQRESVTKSRSSFL